MIHHPFMWQQGTKIVHEGSHEMSSLCNSNLRVWDLLKLWWNVNLSLSRIRCQDSSTFFRFQMSLLVCISCSYLERSRVIWMHVYTIGNLRWGFNNAYMWELCETLGKGHFQLGPCKRWGVLSITKEELFWFIFSADHTCGNKVFLF